MNVLVTGANGFIGKNVSSRLGELSGVSVTRILRSTGDQELREAVVQCDVIVHLAGENRPQDPEAFEQVNVGLTQRLCRALIESGRCVPVLFASSTQAQLDNPYGRSKLVGELLLSDLSKETGSPVAIYRLPGVFGKWCKPNYNSVVATFCHNIVAGIPLQVNDPGKMLRLVYVDDVVDSFIAWMRSPTSGCTFQKVIPEYDVELGELARLIGSFMNGRRTLEIDRVGAGLVRALYATYVSYLSPQQFFYDLPTYRDSRGVFVEMLKTRESGQVSFFTAHPGVVRGGHYHHTKTEKFLVVMGRARFGFRNILTGEVCTVEASGESPRIVETIPGWAHDICNIGDGEMVVMLWANEVFDRDRPDTIAEKV